MSLLKRLLQWLFPGVESSPRSAPPDPLPEGEAPPTTAPSTEESGQEALPLHSEGMASATQRAQSRESESPSPPTQPAPTHAQPPATARPTPPQKPLRAGKTAPDATVDTRDPAKGSPPRRRPTVRVTIGLDFGTSATKVVIREFDSPAVVFALDAGCKGFEWFATPSSIRENDDHLWFGSESRNGGPGTLHENLKVALLSKQANGPVSRLPEAEVEFLVAAHLTWCLARIRGHLDAEYGPGSYRPFLHVAAPMSQTGAAEKTRKYDRILNAALESAFSNNPPDFSLPANRQRLESCLRPLLTSCTLPEPGERIFRVSPETLAPFVSLLQDKNATLGMHILVDVGAATTEVLVVNLIPRRETGKRFVAYKDSTDWIGGNNFTGPGVQDAQQRLEKHIQTTLREAIIKDFGAASLSAWRNMTLIMSGGGVLQRKVRAVLDSEGWHQRAMEFAARFDRRMHSPTSSDLRTFHPIPRRNFHILANAHGLSVPWQLWEGWFAPDEVEPLERKPAERYKPLVDWEDG